MTALPYSRSNPSPRQQQLAGFYKTMHADGHAYVSQGGAGWIDADKAFRGRELLTHATIIKGLIDRHGSKTILDYGCGKGDQYGASVTVDDTVHANIASYWGVDAIKLYEPALPAFAVLPEGRFDGVVCTDVLEHLSRADVPWIVEEMFAKARHFLFANVACYPAAARLPTGQNAHETVRPGDWWAGVFEAASSRYPGVAYTLLAAEGYNASGRRYDFGGRDQ